MVRRARGGPQERLLQALASLLAFVLAQEWQVKNVCWKMQEQRS